MRSDGKANGIDPEAVKAIYADLQDWSCAQGSLLDLTWAGHVLLVILMQVLAGGVVLGVCVLTTSPPVAWWVYSLPNLLALVVSVLLPLPFRVDR